MEIVIHRKSYDHLVEQNLIKWELVNKKNYFLFAVYAFMGLFFLVINWLTLKDGDNYWGFTTSFGVSLILLSFFYSLHTYQNKLKYVSQTKQFINRRNKQTEGIQITISDTAFMYKDYELYFEMKWTVFTQYKYYGDYLLLIFENNFLGSLIVKKSEISEKDFSELCEFVRGRFAEKK